MKLSYGELCDNVHWILNKVFMIPIIYILYEVSDEYAWIFCNKFQWSTNVFNLYITFRGNLYTFIERIFLSVYRGLSDSFQNKSRLIERPVKRLTDNKTASFNYFRPSQIFFFLNFGECSFGSVSRSAALLNPNFSNILLGNSLLIFRFGCIGISIYAYGFSQMWQFWLFTYGGGRASFFHKNHYFSWARY